MRVDAYKKLRGFRVISGPIPSQEADGNNGAFRIPFTYDPHNVIIDKAVKPSHVFNVIVSDGESWDHVSVHVSIELRAVRTVRTPSWDEMCFIKNLFFEAEEACMQIHPPASRYVNHHPSTLHLWRSHNRSIQMPPLFMV